MQSSAELLQVLATHKAKILELEEKYKKITQVIFQLEITNGFLHKRIVDRMKQIDDPEVWSEEAMNADYEKYCMEAQEEMDKFAIEKLKTVEV